MGKGENIFVDSLKQFQDVHGNKVKIEEEKPSTYLKSSWNFLATFAMVPYRLEWDSGQLKYILSNGFIHKVLSGVVYFIAALSSLSWLASISNFLFKDSSSPVSVASNNVMKIFQLTLSISSVFKLSCFTTIVWGRRKIFLKFVNQLSCFNLPDRPLHKLLLLYIYKLAYCYFSCVRALEVTAMKVRYLRHIFPTELIAYPVMAMDVIGVVLMGGANFLFTSFVMTLSSVADKYENECSLRGRSRKVQMVKGFQMYSNLKKLTKTANVLMGGFLYTIYLENLIFFADCLGSLSNWDIQLGGTSTFVMSAISSSFVWFLACEFHRKCSDVTSEWISECYEEDDGTLSVQDHARISNLSNDLSNSSIALGCRFFTITYGFIGSMFGLIVTYGLIVFQMRAPPVPK